MKMIVLVAAGLAVVSSLNAASAQSLDRDRNAQPISPNATTSPLITLYAVSGVVDLDYSAGINIATSFLCTNFSPVAERIRLQLFNYNGNTLYSSVFQVNRLQTITMSTHSTELFADDVNTATRAINQGSAIISGTSNAIHCSAMIVDAVARTAQGISLHMVRFNPRPGTSE